MPKNNNGQKESLVRPVIVLCLICLVTTGLLSMTYSYTAEAREKQAADAANADRLSMFPEAVTFETISDPDPKTFDGLTDAFLAKDAGGKALGCLVSAKYRGYGGDVPILAAFGLDGKIIRVKVLTNDETPGLGKKVENESFLGQFTALGIDKDLTVKPYEDGKVLIDAISGATISSRAVTEAVNAAIRYIRQAGLEVR